jgi:hypothetical protein
MQLRKFISGIVCGSALYVAITMLQGCMIGEGCAIPPPSEQSSYRVDPEWTKNNLNKEAFEFECTSRVFPPLPGTNGKLINTIAIDVKDIYLDVLGRPTAANLAQIRADALYRAKQAAIEDIKRYNPSVKEVTETSCRETKMLPPDTIGMCKVSENDTQTGAPPDVELPPEGPQPFPTSTSAAIPAPAVSVKK